MTKILSISADNVINEFNVNNSAAVKVFNCDNRDNYSKMSVNKAVGVNSILYFVNSMRMISSHWDKVIRKWDLNTCRMEVEYIGHSDWVYSCVLTKDEKTLYSSSKDGTIREWNVDTGKCTYEFKTRFNSIYTLKFNGNFSRLLFATSDANVYEWDIKTKKIIREYKGHFGRVFSAAYNSDFTKIVTFSEDQTIRIWEVESGQCIKVIYNIMGLLIQGCTFKNLKDQNNSQDIKELIQTYGGQM